MAREKQKQKNKTKKNKTKNKTKQNKTKQKTKNKKKQQPSAIVKNWEANWPNDQKTV